MQSTIAKWEDDENNRQVQYSVDYTIENGSIEIVNVTPRQVDFTCETKDSVGVHTAKGKIHLASKIQASGHLDRIKSEIAAKEELLTNA